eukprot:CAMPEP_0119570688 /NCGR_PEP_ID=MMETSP1352-20130426/43738_1 /TAXON_ID=265584 /ORGANISM="Stauroneis constricta, Strain CCMP1120" /LENGTH=788 /DNA_ID=CAMNT_0007620359 /DNA_START=19 /DNA_END=2386 /DNA_ORIENTATION=-
MTMLARDHHGNGNANANAANTAANHANMILIMKKQRQAKEMIQQADDIIVRVNAVNAAKEAATPMMTMGSISAPPQPQPHQTSQLRLAETILRETCATVSKWHRDYEEEDDHGDAVDVNAGDAGAGRNIHNGIRSHKTNTNPFGRYLSQAQHRLAQTSLLLGKLDAACALLLRIIHRDPYALSLSALAMAWYDVALVYLRQGQWQRCQRAVNQAMIVMRSKPRSGPTHTLLVPVPAGGRPGSLSASLSLSGGGMSSSVGGGVGLDLDHHHVRMEVEERCCCPTPTNTQKISNKQQAATTMTMLATDHHGNGNGNTANAAANHANTNSILIMKKQRQAREMIQQADDIIIRVNAVNAAKEAATPTMTMGTISAPQQPQPHQKSQLRLAETILRETCATVSKWHRDYEEEDDHGDAVDVNAGDAGAGRNIHNGIRSHKTNTNPFGRYLSQAQHRLAQTSLLLGKLDAACALLLRIIHRDPYALSLSALAMAWYDVALVYLRQGQWQRCQRAVNQALIVMRSKPRSGPTHTLLVPVPAGGRPGSLSASLSLSGGGMSSSVGGGCGSGSGSSPCSHGSGRTLLLQVGPDETMTVLLHQVATRLREQQQRQQRPRQNHGSHHSSRASRGILATLPWSIQFAVVTTAFGVLTDAVAMPLSRILPVESRPIAGAATEATTETAGSRNGSEDDHSSSVTAASIPAIPVPTSLNGSVVGSTNVHQHDDEDEQHECECYYYDSEDEESDEEEDDGYGDEYDDDETAAMRRYHDKLARSVVKEHGESMDPSSSGAAGAA